MDSSFAPSAIQGRDSDATQTSTEPTSTIAPYHTGLNGVSQSQNMLFKDVLWWSLGLVAVIILLIRILEIAWARMRLITAMSWGPEKQGYWRISQWSWMPFIKKHITYAPLWRKRHNREIRLSSALNVGTLPSRLHTILLLLYLISNIVYMFLVDWAAENKYELCAEIRGRAGTLGLVNMVPLVILAGRNNPLIPLLKISFDTYNLLHRWLGRIVVVEVIIHMIAWGVPAVADGGWALVRRKMAHDNFICSGTVGTVAMVVLLITAVSPLRHAFYETFVHTHIILAFIVFICTWVHCASALLPNGLPQLPWTIAIMGLWLGDRIARMMTIVYVNWSDRGFTEAQCEALPCDATRVTLHLPRYVDVQPGTHAYLRFKGLNVWESHPFSIAWVQHQDDRALPVTEKQPLHAARRNDCTTRVAFIIGAQTGMTRKLHEAAKRGKCNVIRLKAAMEGPYAGHHSLDSYGHAVLFAGSTGITHQLSYIRHILAGYMDGTVATRRLTLVWVVREYESLEWVRPYMDAVLRMPGRRNVLRVQVFVTRPRDPRDLASASDTVRLFPGRPNVNLILAKEVEEQVGAMCVTVCGPGAFADDVRGAVRAVQGGSVVDFVEESFTW